MAEEEDAVARVVHAFAETWNRHDMVAFAALFAQHAEFVNVVGMWWHGREEIRRAHEVTHAGMFRSSRLAILETAVRFPASGLAIARARWKLEGHTSPEGAVLPPREGILVLVLARAGAAWSIIDAQNTDIVDGVLSRPQ